MKNFPKLLLSSIAIAAAASVGAAEVVLVNPVTVEINSWTYGQGNAVNVASPTYGYQGGGFTGKLSNAGAYNNASFETYCVELGQFFNWNNSNNDYLYKDYRIVKGDTYALWAGNPTTAGRIGQLMTYVDTLGALDDKQSTGVQLALWELIYEKNIDKFGNGYSLDTGSFQNTPTTPNLFANSLLLGYKNVTSLYNVDVLANGNMDAGKQDFLILTAVPEPEGYALAFAGLAMVGVFGRKFRSAKKA